MTRGAAVLLLAVLTLAACASSRQREGPELVRAAGWQWEILPAGPFDLAVAAPRRAGAETLTVYLEGDGFAYVTAGQPARDPTPADPVALRLALADPAAGATAWIGRPCQYTQPEHGRGCQVGYWTTRRYAPEVLDSVEAALDVLKRRSGSRRLVLVGYSGGGAVAVLLAARRADVVKVITVAADLDLDYWTRRDGFSPLSGSLDPARYSERLRKIPQLHFTGGKDRVVGTDVVRSYLDHFPPDGTARLVEIPDFTHSCCWARDWPSLLSRFDRREGE